MSLLLNANITEEDDEASISQKAKEISYRILEPYVQNKKDKYSIFEVEEKNISNIYNKPEKGEINKMLNEPQSFTYTDSRKQAYNACVDFLTIRESGHKIEGLGGVLLEGEPGVGKSIFLLAVLKVKGYTEYKFDDDKEPLPNINTQPKDNKKFVYLPSDVSYEDKKKILNTAYKSGFVVVMDELNTPLSENLLNDLVGTKKTDSKQVANGFMVLGTQNPAYMAGREVTSAAIKNRFLQITLPNYTKDELYEIEQKKHPKITKESLNEILQEFINMQTEARKTNKDPVSLRLLQDYLNVCDEIIDKSNILVESKLINEKPLVNEKTKVIDVERKYKELLKLFKHKGMEPKSEDKEEVSKTIAANLGKRGEGW